MVDKDGFKAFIHWKGVSITKIADEIGVAPETIFAGLDRGSMGSDVIDGLKNALEMSDDDAMRIFFKDWDKAKIAYTFVQG